jgi:hypothetical protein
MDPALQTIIKHINKLGVGQDKLQEPKKETSSGQDQLAASQANLESGIGVINAAQTESEETITNTLDRVEWCCGIS